MKTIEEFVPQGSMAAACRSVGVPRATLYRRRQPKPPASTAMPRPRPPRALSDQERGNVANVLHSDHATAHAAAGTLRRGAARGARRAA